MIFKTSVRARSASIYYHAHKRCYNDAVDIWFAHDEIPVIYKYEVIRECLSPEHAFYDSWKNTCACCSRPSLKLENTSSYIV